MRRRRYPLDQNGKLIVAEELLIDQEDDSGKFASGGKSAFSRLPFIPTMVDRRSTFRIFALLSPVPGCKPAPKARAQEISRLESPFLVEAPFGEQPSEWEARVAALQSASAFGAAFEDDVTDTLG